jgi:hypothetical protein
MVVAEGKATQTVTTPEEEMDMAMEEAMEGAETVDTDTDVDVDAVAVAELNPFLTATTPMGSLRKSVMMGKSY